MLRQEKKRRTVRRLVLVLVLVVVVVLVKNTFLEALLEGGFS